ncbi:MAG: TIGR02281 family clan AA aspartic protease, partial [Burkholderiales bacterium]|nr:TIGR02281 family clan AA aspartic protease [Burkholderiales bacterium]
MMQVGSNECTTAGRCGRIARLCVLLAGLAAQVTTAQEPQIEIAGLSEGKAVVVDASGRPKVYREGDTLPGGAKLIRATAESALFEVDGKRHSLKIGSHISAAPAARSGTQRVILTADAQGHFETIGSIDGASVRFLVDTGATMISMSAADARRIGLNYLKGRPGYASTANGTIRVYGVRLNSVRVGDIALTNVAAAVHDAPRPFVL